MSLRPIFVFVLALMFSSGLAAAQSCNFAITNINFGSVNLRVGGATSTSGTLTATCSGTPNSTITICPDIGDGTGGSTSGNPRYLVFGTSKVPYNLYQPSSAIWGSFVWPYPPVAPVLSLTLNGSGTGTLTQTINAQITGSLALAPAGLYTSVYSSGHTLMDYGYAPSQSCTTVSSRAARPAFTVSANNNNSCNISTTPLSFGTSSNLGVAQNATNQISITCTNGVKYTVGLSNGANGGTGPTNRFLASPATTQKITYGIYQNAARTAPWGSTAGTNTIASTATGLTQVFNAYGQIPIQATPAGGAYADTVVVTLTY